MSGDVVVALIAALVGSGGVFSTIAAMRNRLPKETVIAGAAEKTVVTMGRALDAMEQRALTAERERDEALSKLAEMEAKFRALRRDLDEALTEIKRFRDQAAH